MTLSLGRIGQRVQAGPQWQALLWQRIARKRPSRQRFGLDQQSCCELHRQANVEAGSAKVRLKAARKNGER
jgi:hypothetical protein